MDYSRIKKLDRLSKILLAGLIAVVVGYAVYEIRDATAKSDTYAGDCKLDNNDPRFCED